MTLPASYFAVPLAPQSSNMIKANLIELKAFPALNGDCTLISYFAGHDRKKHILVDCGYPATYKNYLQQVLKKLAVNDGNLARLILTHIDADHIMGAIPFLLDNQNEFIGIEQVWHNTFRHIQPLAPAIQPKGSATQNRQFLEMIERGYRKTKDLHGGNEISAFQGTTIGALILKNKYRWNTDFQGAAVSTDIHQNISIDGFASIFLLSPGNNQLVNLARYWKEELRKYNLSLSTDDTAFFDDAFEMMVSWEKNMPAKTKPIAAGQSTIAELANEPFHEDTSIANGSSIAFILQIDDKKILLLGDAHPTVIASSLNKFQSTGLIIFDLIKLAHHGSFNNISKTVLARTDSPRYLFSGNGKNGHPDLETIAYVVSRSGNFLRTLYFNYRTPHSEYFNKPEWMVAYNYNIHYLDTTDYTITL